MTIRIVEIIGRSTQGITRPFLCRGDDGLQYYVKGHGAGRRALICEWLAGHLGLRLGLPIPPFAQAVIPPELIRFSARDDIQDLGAGVGFGSHLVENVDELAYLFIEQIDPKLRAKILLFDWWVCNGDRTLSPDGGNPNLLWSHRDQRLHVIDHNLALDDSDVGGFWDEHIFHPSAGEWTPAFRDEMTRAMPRWLKCRDGGNKCRRAGWKLIAAWSWPPSRNCCRVLTAIPAPFGGQHERSRLQLRHRSFPPLPGHR